MKDLDNKHIPNKKLYVIIILLTIFSLIMMLFFSSVAYYNYSIGIYHAAELIWLIEFYLVLPIIVFTFLYALYSFIKESENDLKKEKEDLEFLANELKFNLYKEYKKDIKILWGNDFYEIYFNLFKKRKVFLGRHEYKILYEVYFLNDELIYKHILNAIKNIYPYILAGDFDSDLKNQEEYIKNIDLKDSDKKIIILNFLLNKVVFYKKESEISFKYLHECLAYSINEVNNLLNSSIPYMSKEEAKFKSVKVLYEEEKFGLMLPADKILKKTLATKDKNIIKSELTEIEKKNDFLKSEISLLENDFKKLEILLEKIKVFDSDFIENANAYIEHIDSLLSEVQNV